MTPSSKVSVVIPAYNGAAHIAQAVRSVWAQDYSNLELIVVDDGSQDDTNPVLYSLANEGALRILRQARGGRSAARNRGIQESAGEWIAFLDADDYWLPQKLKSQVTALEQNGGDFSYCGTLVLDDLGRFVRARPAAPSACLLHDLLWGTQFATSTVVVKRSLLARVGGFDVNLSIGEDWDLWLRLAAFGHAACIEEPLVGKRHGDWDGKGYALKDYEASVLYILSRFFADTLIADRLADIRQAQPQVWSWHYAVLAKSFFAQRDFPRASLYAARAIANHPYGARYLMPKASPTLDVRYGSKPRTQAQ